MIYNLIKYLETVFPTENIYVNAQDFVSPNNVVPDRRILIQETGGIPVPWIKNTTVNIQVLVRDVDMPKARALSFAIFNEINDRYGLILPANTVDSIVYPAIQTGQISANVEPQCLGYDEQGRSEFSTNYRIIYRR